MTSSSFAVTARTWFRTRGRGWSDRHWISETLETPNATWFSRIAEQGDPALPPVVLVHGLIVSGSYFRPVANALDEHLRLYVPDLPGFGRSRSRRGVWSIAELADGLADWLEWHHLRGAVLVSNSLGCQVLTLLALHRPDFVRALILVAPTMDPAARSIVKLMGRGLLDIPRESTALWSVWLPDLIRAGARRGILTLRDGLRDEQFERLPEVSAPTYVVGGERDPIAPPDWVRAMARSMPRGRQIVIPCAPHAMNFSNPRDLGRIIRVAVADVMGIRADEPLGT